MSQALYLRQLQLGPMDNFVYLLGAEDSPEVVVVDPAWDAEAIERAAAEAGKRLAGVLLSHSHYDHLNALPELLRRHDLPVYAQKAEIDFSPELREFGEALRPISPGDALQFGSLQAKALHTPGHTPGSQCLWAAGVVVTGDTLFVNGCGRCDMAGGDPGAMYRSIREVLLALPEETRVLPGHDYGDVPTSTLERERAHNPYLQLPDPGEFIAYRMRPRT